MGKNILNENEFEAMNKAEEMKLFGQTATRTLHSSTVELERSVSRATQSGTSEDVADEAAKEIERDAKKAFFTVTRSLEHTFSHDVDWGRERTDIEWDF